MARLRRIAIITIALGLTSFWAAVFLAGADLKQQAPRLVAQEIRYRLSEAGQVFLVWGTDGWKFEPEERRPAGTVIENHVMTTPMERSGDRFVVKLQLPQGTAIDYGFQVRTLRDGSPLPVWTWDGDYRTVASDDRVVDVAASLAGLRIRAFARDGGLRRILLIALIALIGGACLWFVARLLRGVLPGMKATRVDARRWASEPSDAAAGSSEPTRSGRPMNPSAPAKPRARIFNATKTIIYLLVIWSALFLAAELGWRTYLYAIGKGFYDDPKEFTSPFFTTYEEPQPYKSGHTAWYHAREVPLDKPPNEIRIICFGGSTTANWSLGISYTDILERKFEGRYKGYTVRVLNAGSDGYSTAHILVNLGLRNLDIHPDIITVYENINDLSVMDFGKTVASDYANKYKTDFYLGLRHRTGIVALIARVSRLARAVISQVPALMFPRNVPEVGRNYPQVRDYFRTNLRSITGLAKVHGIRMVLASQPAKAPIKNDVRFMEFNETVREVASQEHVSFIDVADFVTDDDLFVPDAIHYTRKGLERVADGFFGPLDELVKQVIVEREGR
jgi:hypothetical protein